MALALVSSELSLFRKDISSPEMSQKASASKGAGRGFFFAVSRAFRGYVQSTNRRFPALGIFFGHTGHDDSTNKTEGGRRLSTSNNDNISRGKGGFNNAPGAAAAAYRPPAPNCCCSC